MTTSRQGAVEASLRLFADRFTQAEGRRAVREKSLDRQAVIEWAMEFLIGSGQDSPLDMIAHERQRQIDVEGFDAAKDDRNRFGELARAAACYAVGQRLRYFNGWISHHGHGDEPRISDIWPWSDGWWKPSPENRIRDMAKAGALIVAEIERLSRKGGGT